MKKNILKDYALAAFDACNRKRDTICYMGLTAVGVGCALTKIADPVTATEAILGVTLVREAARSVTWRAAGGVREGAAAANAARGALVTVAFLDAAVNIRFGYSPVAHMLVAVASGYACHFDNRDHLLGGPRGILKMYQDKLWNWPDKHDPKPPAPKKKTLAQRLRESLPRPAPVAG